MALRVSNDQENFPKVAMGNGLRNVSLEILKTFGEGYDMTENESNCKTLHAFLKDILLEKKEATSSSPSELFAFALNACLCVKQRMGDSRPQFAVGKDASTAVNAILHMASAVALVDVTKHTALSTRNAKLK